MAPPPFVANRAGRRRGPPPFIVQLLRAPLTINNIIALVITKSVQHHRRIVAHDALASLPAPPFPPPAGHHGHPHPHPHPPHHMRGPCALTTADHLFSLLSFIFIFSIVHNVLTVARMHRIRKSVFGESMCAARRRWRRGEMTEEEQAACGEKFREMGKRMPSLLISGLDMVFAVGFLGLWMLTVLFGSKERKVELGVGYASVGALVACIMNFLIGVNGLKLWARNKRQQKEAARNVEDASELVDEKAQLIEN